jgi:hypothetical protein
MKNFSIAVFILSAVFCVTSCKPDKVTIVDFTKYTVTDTACQVMGAADATDWTYDTTWTTQETSLLGFADTLTFTDSIGGLIQVSPACTNPSSGLFHLTVNTELPCKLKYSFVNNDFLLLHYGTRKLLGGNQITIFDFRSLTAFHKNQNYRMYYGFYLRHHDKDSIIYKGHGDIRIEE